MKKIMIAIATLLITFPAFAGSPPSRHHGHDVMQAQAHMKTGQGPTYMVRTPNHHPIPNEGVKLMDPDICRCLRAQRLSFCWYGHRGGTGRARLDTLLPNLRSALANRIRAIVTIAVTKALPLTSPAYDEGKT